MELKELQKKYGITNSDFQELLEIYRQQIQFEIYSAAGKKGGNKNKKKGRAYFKRISKLGLEARRRKKNGTN